jgi:galactoside O-acetyltransferase
MTQYERMISGLIYDTCDEEIMEMQRPFKEKLWEFNQLGPFDSEKKEAYMKEVFAECGEYCCIELPFHASWGGSHVHFGTGIYANSNLTLIDDGHIYVGNRVLFGPNVVVATANHPLDPKLRRYEMQYNRDVYIGENVWIGAGATILPGVHVGKNSVIGACSVVTRDVPENVLAVGTPCRVVREIGEQDREFYYRDDRIDWTNLSEICTKKSKHPKFQ